MTDTEVFIDGKLVRPSPIEFDQPGNAAVGDLRRLEPGAYEWNVGPGKPRGFTVGPENIKVSVEPGSDSDERLSGLLGRRVRATVSGSTVNLTSEEDDD